MTYDWLPDFGVESYYADRLRAVYLGDCRELLAKATHTKFDLVLTDPPYGVTQHEEDVKVDLNFLFGLSLPVVVFSQQPFTSELVIAHKDVFKYDLVWDKVLTTGFLNANRMPLRRHEVILVFGDVKYTAIKAVGQKNHSTGGTTEHRQRNYGDCGRVDNADILGCLKHPTSVLTFAKTHPSKVLHRTEKPVGLVEWLVRSYSAEGDIVLDPFIGSGTTAVACGNVGRKCVGIDVSEDCCRIAAARCTADAVDKIKRGVY